ncbi:hypothetical protein EF096_01705 [Pseudomonas neustonica]|uniref:Antitoxin n=1 Tax=Pseudomonas neustonica TaxID=2487346 RepID=A0ABX9XMZ5_9PSED|nr:MULTISPECIES: hypothetical protein [Pseudomonas]ROZ86953.1 hypothetical protein EF099_00995 [Pseudomonas sp. SSM44]ROZ88431.1 hypothetical protein EF096_01705 [Pseudomonas neustonica]
MLELDKAFKDSRTRYIVDDMEQSKTILFNPPADDLEAALKTGREVSAEEWDQFVTKSMRKEQSHD